MNNLSIEQDLKDVGINFVKRNMPQLWTELEPIIERHLIYKEPHGIETLITLGITNKGGYYFFLRLGLCFTNFNLSEMYLMVNLKYEDEDHRQPQTIHWYPEVNQSVGNFEAWCLTVLEKHKNELQSKFWLNE